MFLAAPGWLRGSVRPVAAFDASALVLLAVFWFVAIKRDATATYRRAAVDDPGRDLVLAIVVLASLFGLVAAVTILGRGPAVPPEDRSLALGIGLVAVVLGWAVIHTTFVLRYAHLYYVDDPVAGTMRKGLTFPGTSEPSDYDFAYFSFVIGMTFQVSDVVVVDPDVRRTVLIHGLVSFAYNTTIVALVVNLASNLLGSH